MQEEEDAERQLYDLSHSNLEEFNEHRGRSVSAVQMMQNQAKHEQQQQDDDEDAASADVFADLGSNILPWHRAISASADESSKSVHAAAHASSVTMDKEISDMTRSVYDSFGKRETELRTTYANTRFYMIESFVSTEMLKYEMLLKQLRDSADKRTDEEIDVKLAAEQSKHVSLEQDRDQRIHEIRVTWLLKLLKAGEDFHDKSRLVRSMFRRTGKFFNELNTMEYVFLTQQHAREVAKQQVLSKLHTHDHQSATLTVRLQEAEAAQQLEIQSLQFNGLKEVYVRMLQKEWDTMDNHLSMLETLYQLLHRTYVDIMNLKIRHTRDWYTLRENQNRTLEQVTRRLKDECAAEFLALKSAERDVEMGQVKRSAAQDRKNRLSSFDHAQVVASSELVFGMTMSKDKQLFVIDDTSSDGTFDLEDEDLVDCKNAAFLKLIKNRIQMKAVIESKYNDLISREIKTRRSAETKILEASRQAEREALKDAMELYFEREQTLESKIQAFLTSEKRAIEGLKTAQKEALQAVALEHATKLDAIKASQDQMETAATTVQNALVVPPKEASIVASAVSTHGNNDMVAAHVYHEMRNVLASLMCLSENLRQDPSCVERVAEEQTDICKYALETMNDMLDISKIRQAGYTVKKERVNLSALFDTVMRVQGPRLKKGVTLRKVVPADLEVLTDRKQLLQLLINLLSNAAKFTNAGFITMYAALITRAGQKVIKLGVADTGIGVALSLSKKINAARDRASGSFMDTHSQLSADSVDYKMTEYSVRNSGYGLFLASTIAGLLETSMKVVSPLPKQYSSDLLVLPDTPGSFFYICLQWNKTMSDVVRTAAAPIAAPLNAWQFKPSGLMRVLIVDDQRLLRQSMVMVLKSLCEQCPHLKIRIHTACCAEEALRKASKYEYDLITLDQYYDQTMLSTSTPGITEVTTLPPARVPLAVQNELLLDTNAAENRARYKDFVASEHFDTQEGDGLQLGTDIVPALKALPYKPIILSCTGSGEITYPYLLTKPYNLDSFSQLMLHHMTGFLVDTSVQLQDEHMQRGKGLILYRMQDMSDTLAVSAVRKPIRQAPAPTAREVSEYSPSDKVSETIRKSF